MGTWTEANYLERLQTPLKHALEASENACPDAEMMQAYASGSGNEFVHKAVGEHLKMCADCRGLAERIAAFDAVGANAAALTSQEQVEWANAEKRLDIEAENYARRSEVNFKRAAELERGERVSESRVAANVERGTPWVFPWRKTAWSLAAVAALVILGLVLTRREGLKPSGAAQAPVAAVPQSARPVVPPPIAVANDAGATSPAPGSTVNELLPPGASASPAVRPHRPKPISSSAGNRTAIASKTADDATNQPKEVAANAAPTPAPSSSRTSSARSPIGARTASNRLEPAQSVTDITPAQPMPAPVPPGPDKIHLLSGTRVWILLGTVTRENDKDFMFTGSLFQPVAGPGNTALAAGTDLEGGTEVHGTGVMQGGKMSLYIKEFAIRGVHYRLASANGAANSAQAGGGAAVPFNAGQVQEMWLAAAADYEKVAAGGSNP
jgi:hypothetical protein